MASCTCNMDRGSLPGRRNRRARARLQATVTTISVMAALWTWTALSLAAETAQQRFPSAEAAVTAMAEALNSGDTEALTAVFGSGSGQLVASGDPVSDQAERDLFLEHYNERHLLKTDGADRMVLIVGSDEWPFPIPIVKTDGGWRFDTEEGRMELLARRIGRNELNTIQVCLAYVDAQREYAAKDRNGDGLLEYAQRFASEPGRKNGLYWEAGEGEELSPMGPLFAEAQEAGYLSGKTDDGPSPYHGYYFRILTAQGEDAPGGAYDYLAGDRMIGGFALVAYPAQYGASGIMTFMTSHDGEVYQKDLGEDTETAVRAMTRFNPDDGWEAVETTDSADE